MLMPCAENGMVTTRSMLMMAGFVALGATLVATSGLAGPGSSQLLLAFGAIVALSLTRAPRR
jgi:hypothetical protein